MKNLTKFLKDVAPLFATVVIGVIAGRQLDKRFVEPKLAAAKPVFTAPTPTPTAE